MILFILKPEIKARAEDSDLLSKNSTVKYAMAQKKCREWLLSLGQRITVLLPFQVAIVSTVVVGVGLVSHRRPNHAFVFSGQSYRRWYEQGVRMVIGSW